MVEADPGRVDWLNPVCILSRSDRGMDSIE